MKKLIVAGISIASMALTGIGTGIASAASQPLPNVGGMEGCAIFASTGPLVTSPSDTCSYQPTAPGGFVGNDFTITIYKLETVLVNNVPTQEQIAQRTFTQSDTVNDVGCAMWSPTSSGAPYTNIDLVVGQGEDTATAVVFGNAVALGAPATTLSSCT